MGGPQQQGFALHLFQLDHVGLAAVLDLLQPRVDQRGALLVAGRGVEGQAGLDQFVAEQVPVALVEQPLHALANALEGRRLTEAAGRQFGQVLEVGAALVADHRNAAGGVEHRALDALRIAHREVAGDHPAQRLAGDVRLLDVQRIHQLAQLLDVVGDRILDVGLLRRQAVADIVEGNHVVVLAKGHHVLGVGLDMAADAVHQDQRLGLAVAGFGDTGAAIGGQIDVADLGAQKVQPDAHVQFSAVSIRRSGCACGPSRSSGSSCALPSRSRRSPPRPNRSRS
ncbi:hypothetical protein D3C78_658380 [compost metagenome]